MIPTSTRRAVLPILLTVLCACAAGAVVGCGATLSALEPTGGCELAIRETTGTIQPRDSGLSCEEIKEMFIGIPAEPGGFLLATGPGAKPWHCHLYGSTAPGSTILGCERDERSFAIVAD